MSDLQSDTDDMRTPLRVAAGGKMERRTSGSARTVDLHHCRCLQQATSQQSHARGHWGPRLRKHPSLRGHGPAAALCGGARETARLEPACRCCSTPEGPSKKRKSILGKEGKKQRRGEEHGPRRTRSFRRYRKLGVGCPRALYSVRRGASYLTRR